MTISCCCEWRFAFRRGVGLYTWNVYSRWCTRVDLAIEWSVFCILDIFTFIWDQCSSLRCTFNISRLVCFIYPSVFLLVKVYFYYCLCNVSACRMWCRGGKIIWIVSLEVSILHDQFAVSSNHCNCCKPYLCFESLKIFLCNFCHFSTYWQCCDPCLEVSLRTCFESLVLKIQALSLKVQPFLQPSPSPNTMRRLQVVLHGFV